MKRLILALLMPIFVIGMYAQDEQAKSGWVTGEQESSFPGEMIKYAVCNATKVVEGTDGPITMTFNVMKFRGTTQFFFSCKGEKFLVNEKQAQGLLLGIDNERQSYIAFYASSPDGMVATTLKALDSDKGKIRNMLKKGKVMHMKAMMVDTTQEYTMNGRGQNNSLFETYSFDFNIEGLDAEYWK